MMLIGMRIADILGQMVVFHSQEINGPKQEQPIFPGKTTGTMVTITRTVDGVKRCRTRAFKSPVELVGYLVKTYGDVSGIKLAYYVPGEQGNMPFFFQTYHNGIIYNG